MEMGATQVAVLQAINCMGIATQKDLNLLLILAYENKTSNPNKKAQGGQTKQQPEFSSGGNKEPQSLEHEPTEDSTCHGTGSFGD